MKPAKSEDSPYPGRYDKSVFPGGFTSLALVWVCFCAAIAFFFLYPISALACDPVPAEYQRLKNPYGPKDIRVSYWKRQFSGKCARCHGESGEGTGEEAGSQKEDPANLADKAFMASCSDGQLFYQITFGGEEKSAMPAFGPESAAGWSEERVWKMATFIRRLSQ